MCLNFDFDGNGISLTFGGCGKYVLSGNNNGNVKAS